MSGNTRLSHYQSILEGIRSPESGWEDHSEPSGDLLIAYAPSAQVSLEVFFQGGMAVRYTVTFTGIDQSMTHPISSGVTWRAPSPAACWRILESLSI